MFFCCNLCEIEFRNMIEELKRRTGWKAIDEIKIKGDPRGRECTAISGDSIYRFLITFDSKGRIETFDERNRSKVAK